MSSSSGSTCSLQSPLHSPRTPLQSPRPTRTHANESIGRTPTKSMMNVEDEKDDVHDVSNRRKPRDPSLASTVSPSPRKEIVSIREQPLRSKSNQLEEGGTENVKQIPRLSQQTSSYMDPTTGGGGRRGGHDFVPTTSMTRFVDLPAGRNSVVTGTGSAAVTMTTNDDTSAHHPLMHSPQQQRLESSSQQGTTTSSGKKIAATSSRSPARNSAVASSSTTTPSSSSPVPEPQQQQATKSIITMEYNDEYVGDTTVIDTILVPHGEGTLQSPIGQHCYVGDFVHRLRDGYGKLVTERYVLWAKWKSNRPDFSCSARIDYTTGDKYCGYIDAIADIPAANTLAKQGSLSKFSVWVKTTRMSRERWGEHVSASGDRYFGQWERNEKDGFGCYTSPNGDRYIGMFMRNKFHGSGVLFTAPTPCYTMQGLSNMGGLCGSMTYDGIWENGVFTGEEGHEIFPCKTRITADWSSMMNATNGMIYFASRAAEGKRWVETFQWESLLCGCSETSKKRDFAAAIHQRYAIINSHSREEVESHMKKLISENTSITNSLKIFRRCFYFLFGTCGNSSEIGAGLGSNKLGWCYVRNAFGGCIHHGRGRVIQDSDVSAAVSDIYTFVMSMRRWVVELMSQEGVQRIIDFECETVLTRTLLDLVLKDVHGPLFNLYVQAYRAEDAQIHAALKRLRGLNLDALGVRFGRSGTEEELFDPYFDAITSFQSLKHAHSLSEKLATLRKWSHDIDMSTRMAQVVLEKEQLEQYSSFVKGGRASSRMGGAPNSDPKHRSHGPKHHEEDCEEEESMRENVRSSGELHAARSRTSGLHQIPQETEQRSAQDDEASQLLPVSDDRPLPDMTGFDEDPPDPQLVSGSDVYTPVMTGTSNGSNSKLMTELHESPSTLGEPRLSFTARVLERALELQSGSADDLLPIHQYVLLKSNVSHMYAEMQILVDFSADDTFVDSTSQDSFCITTLHACLSTLPELFPDIRDNGGVVTPVSMFVKRIEEILGAYGDNVLSAIQFSLPTLLSTISDVVGRRGIRNRSTHLHAPPSTHISAVKQQKKKTIGGSSRRQGDKSPKVDGSLPPIFIRRLVDLMVDSSESVDEILYMAEFLPFVAQVLGAMDIEVWAYETAPHSEQHDDKDKQEDEEISASQLVFRIEPNAMRSPRGGGSSASGSKTTEGALLKRILDELYRRGDSIANGGDGVSSSPSSAAGLALVLRVDHPAELFLALARSVHSFTPELD